MLYPGFLIATVVPGLFDINLYLSGILHTFSRHETLPDVCQFGTQGFEMFRSLRDDIELLQAS